MCCLADHDGWPLFLNFGSSGGWIIDTNIFSLLGLLNVIIYWSSCFQALARRRIPFVMVCYLFRLLSQNSAPFG